MFFHAKGSEVELNPQSTLEIQVERLLKHKDNKILGSLVASRVSLLFFSQKTKIYNVGRN